MNKPINMDHELSSGNVFADLELENAEELHARGLIGLQLLNLLEARGLGKQKDIAMFLGIKQPEVSKLMNGDFGRFSEARLIEFLGKLDHKVVFHISPRKHNEPFQQVVYAP